jgi:hypothetical protein
MCAISCELLCPVLQGQMAAECSWGLMVSLPCHMLRPSPRVCLSCWTSSATSFWTGGGIKELVLHPP